jgi:hypothetical protein
MVAPKTYQHHHRTVQCYLALARLLKLRLKTRTTAATSAPRVQRIINATLSANSNDGFIILKSIMNGFLPHLGAIGINFVDINVA